MIDLIKQHAATEAAAGDWSAVASILNGLTRVELITKHWTLGDITALPGGMELAAGIASALVAKGAEGQPDSALFQSVFVAMSTTGVQFHTPDRQALIEAAANGKFPPEAIAAIKSLGQKVTPLLDIPVTAETVQAAWDEDVRATAAGLVDQAFSSVSNEVLNPALAMPERTKLTIAAALRAAADLLEA